MATLGPVPVGIGAIILGTAQTGNVDTTNTLDRGTYQGGSALVITSAVGATPSVTANIQGSVDGSTWFNVPYSLVATPRTFVLTAITITSAVTTTYLLQELVFWRYLKVVYSANTNVTLTTTAYI